MTDVFKPRMATEPTTILDMIPDVSLASVALLAGREGRLVLLLTMLTNTNVKAHQTLLRVEDVCLLRTSMGLDRTHGSFLGLLCLLTRPLRDVKIHHSWQLP